MYCFVNDHFGRKASFSCVVVYVFSRFGLSLGYNSSSASTKQVISSANDMGIGSAAALKLMSQSFIDKNVHLQSFGSKNVTFFRICIQSRDEGNVLQGRFTLM